jgi:hypothetical protein
MRMVSIAAVALLVAAAPAKAEMTVSEFLLKYDQSNASDREFMRFTVSQLESGMSWANAELAAENRAMLYCSPPQLALAGEQALNILRREVSLRPKSMNSLSFGFGLLIALKRTFPCPENQGAR